MKLGVESGDDGSEVQQFDEQSVKSWDDESEHTPAQKSKRQYFVSESDDEERAEETDEETQASRVEKSGDRVLNGRIFRRGTENKCLKMIMKEKLPEFWPNHCWMPSML